MSRWGTAAPGSPGLCAAVVHDRDLGALRRPSLARIALMWLRTVPSLMNSRAATSPLSSPSATASNYFVLAVGQGRERPCSEGPDAPGPGPSHSPAAGR